MVLLGHASVLSTLDTALSLLSSPSDVLLPSSTSAPSRALQSLKLNVVLTRSFNLNELLDFVRLTEKRRMSVRFIEFMPFSGESLIDEDAGADPPSVWDKR